MDCSPPRYSVHEIFQARILEWVAMSSSRGIFPIQGSNPTMKVAQDTGRINDGLPTQSLGFMGVFLEGKFEPQWTTDAGKGISNRGSNV